MKRGFTLIELMIAVALIGIALGTLGGFALTQRRAALDLVLHERALQALEAEAERALRGGPASPAQAAQLKELPGGALTTGKRGDGRVVRVSWRSSRGAESIELVLAERGP